MSMNVCHRLCCSSNYWARSVERKLLPWALAGVDLGAKTLEIGPGYGANLRVLVDRTPDLTCVEIDEPMAARLRERYGSRATVINGDGTHTGLPDADFNSVVCFTMLHHVPTPALQDRLFAEAFRVLNPGGVFSPVATACTRWDFGWSTSATPTTRYRLTPFLNGYAAPGSPTCTSTPNGANSVGVR